MAGTNKQREAINRKLVAMQMEMIGLTYEDAMNTPEFWKIFTLTTQQRETWYKQALPLVKKTFKINATKAKSIIDFFELTLGLRVYDLIEEGEFLSPPPEEIVIPEDLFWTKPEPTFWQKVKKFFVGFY